MTKALLLRCALTTGYKSDDLYLQETSDAISFTYAI